MLRYAHHGDGGQERDPWAGCDTSVGQTLHLAIAEHEGDIHGNALGMNRRKVSVLEERHEVGLSGLLESHDGRGLETEIRLKARCKRQSPIHQQNSHNSP